MAKPSSKFQESLRLLNLRKHWSNFLFLGSILVFNVIFFPLMPAITVSILILVLFFLMASTIISLARAEEVIRNERNYIFGIISKLTDGLVVYDNYFRVLLMNSRAEDLLTIRRENVLGKTIKPEMQNDPKFKTLVQVTFPSLAPRVKRITANYPEVLEINFTEPEEMQLQITTNLIMDAGGKVSAYLKIIHDISRERAISRMKSEFITIAAHQMRTPLAAVRWTFQALYNEEAGTLSDEQKNYVKDGLEVSTHLIKLVGDLLDVARIEEGKFGYEFSMNDVVGLIEQAVSDNRIFANERKVTLALERPSSSLPQIKVDPQKISLVLQNLISNAIKYNRSGGQVTVGVEKDGLFLKISVKDTGVGIPANQLERLFTKFFRGSNVVRLETEGSGLGLFIVKNVVERHGGKIWAESKEGAGSTFYFTLPIEEKYIPPEESPADGY